MGGGVHIDFNLDFLSKDPSSTSATRRIFDKNRAAMSGAMPGWYSTFRRYTSYKKGSIVLYTEENEDLLDRETRSKPNASNLYVCMSSETSSAQNPESSTSWKTLSELNLTHFVGFRSVNKQSFKQNVDNQIHDDEICLNLFEFVDMDYLICKACLNPRQKEDDPIALRPVDGLSMGGGVTRTLDSNQDKRYVVDYPTYGLDGSPIPLPGKVTGLASGSINALLGNTIDALNPTNDPLDPELNIKTYNASEVYQTGDVVNYLAPQGITDFSDSSQYSTWNEDFDDSSHPKLAICKSGYTTPARSSNGDYDLDLVPWNPDAQNWTEYFFSLNRPNSSLGSVFNYIVNNKNMIDRFKAPDVLQKNLANNTLTTRKPRIRMNDFGGKSDIYGHFLVHWAKPLNIYHRNKCRSWYSGASSESGPYQDGQYDIFIYTKNLRKDHGGQPKLAVTFGTTTSVKFLDTTGINTYASATIASKDINSYLQNIEGFNVSEVNTVGDLLHFQYKDLTPAFFMHRGYVHSRRRGGTHPGSSKGNVELGKYILYIEDILSRQRIEMITPQVFSNKNPLAGLHGSNFPHQDWGEKQTSSRTYEYSKDGITDGNLSDLLATQTNPNYQSTPGSQNPLHFLILGNELSKADQEQNKNKLFQGNPPVIDRAFRPVMLRTDELSSETFHRILGLMQTGFPNVSGESFNTISQDKSLESFLNTNPIWVDLGQTSSDNTLFSKVSDLTPSNTLADNILPWSDSNSYKAGDLVKIVHGDYWETDSATNNSPWYANVNYDNTSPDKVYLWSGSSKICYSAKEPSIGLSPRLEFSIFRSKSSNQNTNPVFNHQANGEWVKLEILKNTTGFLKSTQGTINAYSSLVILGTSNLWPGNQRSKAVHLGFEWFSGFKPESIINQIAENNTDVSLQTWTSGSNYLAGDIVSFKSLPAEVQGPDGSYYTYENFIARFGLVYSEEEISLMFTEREAEIEDFAFKCLKSTVSVDTGDPLSYAGSMPGVVPQNGGSIYYPFVSNYDGAPAKLSNVLTGPIYSQTMWKDITQAEFDNETINAADHPNFPYYINGLTTSGLASAFRKRDVFNSGTYDYDLDYESYYQLGDMVKMGNDHKVKINMFGIVTEERANLITSSSGYTDQGNKGLNEEITAGKNIYRIAVDFTLSNPQNYSYSTTRHQLQRSQWWQPVAKRRSQLIKIKISNEENAPSQYVVVPDDFDFLHLEPIFFENSQQNAVESKINVFGDQIKTFDVSGDFWTSDVKNIKSSMINALPSSSLENFRILQLDPPYINFQDFATTDIGGSKEWPQQANTTHALLGDSSTGTHPVVEYFTDWLQSTFDVNFARDFLGDANANASDVSSELYNKFELIKISENYPPTFNVLYDIINEDSTINSPDNSYSPGQTIEIQKGQKIKLKPEMLTGSGSNINSFSYIVNSFATLNVIGSYKRTPREELNKTFSFENIYHSSTNKNPPIDKNGERVVIYRQSEKDSFQPTITRGITPWSATSEKGGMINEGTYVSYAGLIFKKTGSISNNYLSASDPLEDWERLANPLVHGNYDIYSKHPFQDSSYIVPDDTIYFHNDSYLDWDTGQLQDILFSSSVFIVDSDLPESLFSGKQNLIGEIPRFYLESSNREPMLANFFIDANRFDQLNDSMDRLSAPLVWSDVYGPDGDLVSNSSSDNEWSASEVYATNEIVQRQDKFFISSQVSQSVDPLSSNDIWKIIQPWNQNACYYIGDFIYIYESVLFEDPVTNQITRYGPTSTNSQEMFPSLVIGKEYKVNERVQRNQNVYKCHTQGSINSILDFNNNFSIEKAVPEVNGGGALAFFVCEKNVIPTQIGHNPRKTSLLTGIHGDHSSLIRVNDNISSVFSQDQEVIIDFDYESNAFIEGEKKIIISGFSGVDQGILTSIVNDPELINSSPDTIARHNGIASAALSGTGSMNINIKITNNNPDPSSVNDAFEGLSPLSDKVSRKFTTSAASMLIANTFMIKDKKLYAAGLDSSDFGFIGLADVDTNGSAAEFIDAINDNYEEGSKDKSYNKIYPFEQLNNQVVKVFEEGGRTSEVTESSGATHVDSEGGNTVFIYNGKLYGMGHNQGYSLGLCADNSTSLFGLGSRTTGLTDDEKNSESLQDMHELFLNFDSTYYLNKQVVDGELTNTLGDRSQQFGLGQADDIIAWQYVLSGGFYMSQPAEWELMSFAQFKNSVWSSGSAINQRATIQGFDWKFIDKYSSGNSWVSRDGSMKAISDFCPLYRRSEFWQTGALHAYNLEIDDAQASVGSTDAYIESGIFEGFAKLRGTTKNHTEKIKDLALYHNAAQVVWYDTQAHHAGINTTKGGTQPRIGWSGFLATESAMEQLYVVGHYIDDHPVWPTRLRVGGTTKITTDGLLQSLPNRFGSTDSPEQFQNTFNKFFAQDFNFYPNNNWYRTQFNEAAALPNHQLYIENKPFWDPVLGNPDHIVFDFIADYKYKSSESSSGDPYNFLGVYKLLDKNNITWGNYPKNSLFNKDDIQAKIGTLGIPGGDRFGFSSSGQSISAGLTGKLKQIIPARTYVPFATKLVDEDVVWTSTNKYSTFYINNTGQVKALGSFCACPAYEIQGFDHRDQQDGGVYRFATQDITVENFDNYGDLNLITADHAVDKHIRDSEPVFANHSWALVYSEQGTENPTTQQGIQYFQSLLNGDSKFCGIDTTIVNYKNPWQMFSENAQAINNPNADVISSTSASKVNQFKSGNNYWNWHDPVTQELVEAMYLEVLGRPHDDAGRDLWLDISTNNAWGAYQLIDQFLRSDEFQTQAHLIESERDQRTDAVKRNVAMWTSFGNAGELFTHKTDSNKQIRMSRDYIGAVVISNCEREELNGVYRPSTRGILNDPNYTLPNRADSFYYHHASNRAQGLANPKKVYVSDHDTEYGKILIYYDHMNGFYNGLGIWRIQYADRWQSDTSPSGTGYYSTDLPAMGFGSPGVHRPSPVSQAGWNVIGNDSSEANMDREDFADKMFISSMSVDFVNSINAFTGEPSTDGNLNGHQFSHDPLGVPKYGETVDMAEDDEYELTSGGYSWAGDQTDWNYYLDSQPGLESAMRVDPGLVNAAKEYVGLVHWNLMLVDADRANRSLYIRNKAEFRVASFVDSAVPFRGLKSLNHNADWFYDDSLGWVTRAVGTHSPSFNGISSPYASSIPFNWFFSAKYANWFAFSVFNQGRKESDNSFYYIRFINHDFNFNSYTSDRLEYNSTYDGTYSDSTLFISAGEVHVISSRTDNLYIPSSSDQYNQQDSYSYNTGDVVKCELADGNKNYRTLYFMSLKDSNIDQVGFLNSFNVSEAKKIMIPAKKGISKRYDIVNHQTSNDADLSGPITVYDPDDYQGDKATQVTLGDSHAIILTESGRVFGLGDNSNQQIDTLSRGPGESSDIIDDDHFGSKMNSEQYYIEATENNPASPFESPKGWKKIEKPKIPVLKWRASTTYLTGNKVFIENRVFAAVCSQRSTIRDINTYPQGSNPIRNYHCDFNFQIGADAQSISQTQALVNLETSFEQGSWLPSKSELVVKNTIGELFEHDFLNGRGKISPNQNAIMMFVGEAANLHYDNSIKGHYANSRGDSFFLLNKCYIKPHFIESFSESDTQSRDLSFAAVKASGKGSLFLTDSGVLYGIGKNRVGPDSGYSYNYPSDLGNIFGFESTFSNGPELIARDVTFMNKSGDMVSYISGGYSYKAGGKSMTPFLENFKSIGSPAKILDNDGNAIAAKAIFLTNPDFWDYRDWFMERFLSQKINGNYYLKGDYYKEADCRRASQSTRKGGFSSRVFSKPCIGDYIEEWSPSKDYVRHIKEGQQIDENTGMHTDQPENLPAWYNSVRDTGTFSSAFESRMPSIVRYQDKFYQCIKNHGPGTFGYNDEHFLINDRRMRMWQTKSNPHPPSAPFSGSDYWVEVDEKCNKNIAQFLVEKLNLLSFYSLAAIGETGVIYTKGFYYGYDNPGSITSIQDNRQKIASERGVGIVNLTEDGSLIVPKFSTLSDPTFKVNNAQTIDNNNILGMPSVNFFVDIQSDDVEGWKYPGVNGEFSSRLTGQEGVAPFDFLSNSRRFGDAIANLEDRTILTGTNTQNIAEINLDLKRSLTKASLLELYSPNNLNKYNSLFGQTIHGQINNFLSAALIFHGWNNGVSCNYFSGRPLAGDGFDQQGLSFSWLLLDPFSPSFLQSRGVCFDSYSNGKTDSEGSLKNIIAMNLSDSRPDLSILNIPSNKYSEKFGLIGSSLNVVSLFYTGWLDQRGVTLSQSQILNNFKINSLADNILKSPHDGLYNWWDIALNLEGLDFEFMKNYEGIPMGDTALPHLATSLTPESDTSSPSYYNPWDASRSNFANYIMNQNNWSITEHYNPIDELEINTGMYVTNSGLRTILATGTIVAFFENLLATSIEPSFTDSYYDKVVDGSSGFTGVSNVKALTDGYKYGGFFDLPTHQDFMIGSYLCDPASLPLYKDYIKDGVYDSGVSYDAGSIVNYEGFLFTATATTSQAPTVGNYRDGPSNGAGWNYTEPLVLHRYRSQIGVAHQIPWGKFLGADKNDQIQNAGISLRTTLIDTYNRAKYIPQQTIGHSVLDTSFVGRAKDNAGSISSLNNLGNFNFFDRTPWDQTDENSNSPEYYYKNSTKPVVSPSSDSDSMISSGDLIDIGNQPTIWAMRRLREYQKILNAIYAWVDDNINVTSHNNEVLTAENLALDVQNAIFTIRTTGSGSFDFLNGFYFIESMMYEELGTGHTFYSQSSLQPDVILDNLVQKYTDSSGETSFINMAIAINRSVYRVLSAYGLKTPRHYNGKEINEYNTLNGLAYPIGGVFDSLTYSSDSPIFLYDIAHKGNSFDSIWGNNKDIGVDIGYKLENVDMGDFEYTPSGLRTSGGQFHANWTITAVTQSASYGGGVIFPEIETFDDLKPYLDDEDFEHNGDDFTPDVSAGILGGLIKNGSVTPTSFIGAQNYFDFGRAYNAGEEGFINSSFDSDEVERTQRKSEYKFPKQAFPACFGNVTDWMELKSEMSRFGFKYFFSDFESASTIFGRELFMDFYCSQNMNSRIFANETSFTYKDISDNGFATLASNTENIIDNSKRAYVDDFTNKNYLDDANNACSFLEKIARSQNPTSDHVIDLVNNTHTKFDSNVPLFFTAPRDNFAEMKKFNAIMENDFVGELLNDNFSDDAYLNPSGLSNSESRISRKKDLKIDDVFFFRRSSGGLVSIRRVIIPNSKANISDGFSPFVSNRVYYLYGGFYLCKQSITYGGVDTTTPTQGVDDKYFEFLGYFQPDKLSGQSVQLYDKNGGTLPNSEYYNWQDFPHGVRSLRHLRFELNKRHARKYTHNLNTELKYRGSTGVYIDSPEAMTFNDGSTNYGSDHADGNLHAGFFSHWASTTNPSQSYVYVLEGSYAGLATSDYNDIFKPNYSFAWNKINVNDMQYNDQNHQMCDDFSVAIGIEHQTDRNHGITEDEAKQKASKYVINLAKEKEGLDYVWYDARQKGWIVGRNWLQEKKDGSLIYPSEEVAREAANNNFNLSDDDLIEWTIEHYPTEYIDSSGSLKTNEIEKKWIAHDVVYIGGKDHHQCLARINGVIEKWKREMELRYPGTLEVSKGALLMGILGSAKRLENWQQTSISVDIT